MFEKSIKYDRETRDYRMELNGEFVGYARTYQEAEVTLDQLVFDALIYKVVYEPAPANDTQPAVA